MHRLLLLGMNHSTAPLALREALAFSAEQQRKALAAFAQRFPGCEAVLLSTCNRVELYVAGPPHQPGRTELTDFLAQLRGLSRESFEGHLYHLTERHAILHLFAVASSLDSMVLGEAQILGQVRDAYDLARGAQATGALLNSLFQRAIAAGKQVMSQTALGEGRTSVAAIAVEYARRIFEDFADKVVLSIGAGKMTTLMLQNLAALSPGTLLVCNRDPAKAQALAQRFSGQAVPFEALSDHLVAADIVLTCTGSTQPIITRPQVEKLLKRRRYRPLFMIDIALPRDVEGTVAQIEHVYLYDLDHLQRVAAATQSNRQQAAAAARAIVEQCVDEYLLWRRKQEVGPLIDSWFARYHKLAHEEVQRTLRKLPNVTPAEQAHLEELARRIVNKLLHDPIQQLQQTDAQHLPASAYLHALEKLFHLDEVSAAEDPAQDPSPDAPPEQSNPGEES